MSLRDVLDNTPGIYSYAYDTERVLFTSRGFLVDNLMYDGVPADNELQHGLDRRDARHRALRPHRDRSRRDRPHDRRGQPRRLRSTSCASTRTARRRRRSLGFHRRLVERPPRRRRRSRRRSTADGSVRARFVGVVPGSPSRTRTSTTRRQDVFYGIVDADLTPSDAAVVRLRLPGQPAAVQHLGLVSAVPRRRHARRLAALGDDGDRLELLGSPDTNRRSPSCRHAFDNGWSLRGTLSWRRFEEDLALFYVFGFPDPETGEGLEPFAYRSDGKITELALDVHASGRSSLFGREHELVVGYNGSQTEEHRQRIRARTNWRRSGNFFEWDGSYPEPEFDSEGALLTDIDSRQNGVYAAAPLRRWPIRSRLIAGARYAPGTSITSIYTTRRT